jgi:hypothetical protein
MYRTLLTGVRADTPIGAMVSFGLLRLNPSFRLAWDDRIAALFTPAPMSADELVELVSKTAAGRPKPEDRSEFSWSSTLKDVNHEDWVKAVAGATTSEQWEWLAAFGAPGAERFHQTPFDMTSGSQKFPAELAALPVAVTQESVREALFGPWMYRDSTHSLGWDPNMVRAGAFTSVQPRELKKERGVTAAVWLASESLPLFPCFIAEGGRLVVRAWVGHQFRWPVWEQPVTLAGLKALIRNPSHPQVTAVYGSSRTKAGRQPGFGPTQMIFEDWRHFHS